MSSENLIENRPERDGEKFYTTDTILYYSMILNVFLNIKISLL